MEYNAQMNSIAMRVHHAYTTLDIYIFFFSVGQLTLCKVPTGRTHDFITPIYLVCEMHKL